MDYGATYLTAKKTKIKSVSKQSKFEGSDREVRGRIIKQLVNTNTPHNKSHNEPYNEPRRDRACPYPNNKQFHPTSRHCEAKPKQTTLTIPHIKSEFPHKDIEKIVAGLVEEGIIKVKN
ncbi:MAG: hypothetical protein LBO09_04455 [Candidatus Peribacteria bacterium]|jgi:hypothetical protein|nr:hypothetical protein [Candidatus Peribacteria bacterium]